MRTASLPDVHALAQPSPDSPLRILLSGCLSGLRCGYDQSSYGTWPLYDALRRAPHVEVIPFCPEDIAFGTPRELCDIHGGNGFDVLEGRARVLSESGHDWSEPMVRVAHQMLALARERRVDLAILMDMSAACGSQVISDGSRTATVRRYQKGPGVCAALLMRAGIAVVSQRDFRFLEQLLGRIAPGYVPRSGALDHHETQWYRDYFQDEG